MLKQLALAAVFIHATNIPQAVGHGNIYDPKPEGAGANMFYFGGPAGMINMPEMVGKASYGDYYQAVDDWFTKNNIDSVKDYVTEYGSDIAECGNTKKDGNPQPLPSDGYVKHDTLGNSHPGPCEIWCDNTRVFHNANCAGKFAGQVPTSIPIDVSKCKSSSELVFYWLALHVQPWQAYINCVALDGSTAAGSSSTNSSPTASKITTPSKTSKTTTASKTAAAPTFTFDETFDEASVGGEAEDEEETTMAPVATPTPQTKTPAATTAPSTTSSKCLRRRF
ncbi:hypothetical protein PHYPSEUDO_000731 [Phytophthora pseudosyringae]|uniref:Uncharacterized protein n=1 Tax=Phytophthora pseudosyringae TaxID=221518 RepID=A0A8T1V7I0_9STRA|nr:hypothetical protein PHYPSEUDO_000731 [Phytophthora pseudosyringae]